MGFWRSSPRQKPDLPAPSICLLTRGDTECRIGAAIDSKPSFGMIIFAMKHASSFNRLQFLLLPKSVEDYTGPEIARGWASQ